MLLPLPTIAGRGTLINGRPISGGQVSVAAIRAALAVGNGLAELEVLEDRARNLEDLHAERKEIVTEAERDFRDTASEIVHMELI
jgi:alanine dehydrogenase